MTHRLGRPAARARSRRVAAAVVAALCLLPVVAVLGTSTVSAAPAATRSVWAWDASTDLHDVFTWAVEKNVSVVNLCDGSASGNGPSAAELGDLQTLSSRLHAAGKTMNALAGNTTDWAIAANGKAAAWAARRMATGVYDGVLLDVEPWTNETIWGASAPDGSPATAKDAALRQDTMRSYVQMVADLKAAVGPARTVEISTGTWFNYYALDSGKNFLEAVMDAADSVAVMAYNNDTATVEGLVAQELSYGNQTGKTVRIGMETNPRPSSPEETYYGQGSEALETDAATLVSHLAGNRSFGGIIIEDLAGWQALGAGTPPPPSVIAAPVGPGTVALTWQRPDTGPAPTRYRVCWTGTTDDCAGTVGAPTSFTVHGLDSTDSAYRFTVAAVTADGVGARSRPSNVVGTPAFTLTNASSLTVHPVPGYAYLDATVSDVRSNGGGALIRETLMGGSPGGCRTAVPARRPGALLRAACVVAPRGSRYKLAVTLTNVFGTSAATYATGYTAALSRPGPPSGSVVTGTGPKRTIRVTIRGAVGYGSPVTEYVESGRCSRANPRSTGTYTYSCPAAGKQYPFALAARNSNGTGPATPVRVVRSHR
ncbi:MAG: fibronectin type III domain-containing protein [Kineosporiaceae bacterium]